MRFYYWKQLIAVLFVALILWVIPFFLTMDVLTLARSQNREIARYLGKAMSQLAVGYNVTTNVPGWLRETSDNIDAAKVVIGNQAKALERLSKEASGFSLKMVQTYLASIIAILGTFTTIVLSWRKDVHVSHAEMKNLKAKTSRMQ
ncbi:MAG: hypothetical protein MRJ65_14190 [Candidatus Brocadiaceae bacterium]|nr:hypothetical protein [Candidatus Brocadiaceae bacterium]